MSLFQAALIALFTYLTWIGTPWLGGQGIGYQVFGKPLVAGLIVGLIMGDVVNGVIIGATINALYIGAVTPGGAMSSDLDIAGYVGTALALATGVSAEVAVSIAVPLGLIGTFAWQLFATVCSFLAHKADDYAANADTKGITRSVLLYPQLLAFVIRFVPSFLVLFFGATAAQGIVQYIPDWLTSMFSVVGGLLPALGIAVLLKMLVSDVSLLAFFIIGYIAVAVLGMPIFTVTLLGVALALISLLVTKTSEEDSNND